MKSKKAFEIFNFAASLFNLPQNWRDLPMNNVHDFKIKYHIKIQKKRNMN